MFYIGYTRVLRLCDVQVTAVLRTKPQERLRYVAKQFEMVPERMLSWAEIGVDHCALSCTSPVCRRSETVLGLSRTFKFVSVWGERMQVKKLVGIHTRMTTQLTLLFIAFWLCLVAANVQKTRLQTENKNGMWNVMRTFKTYSVVIINFRGQCLVACRLHGLVLSMIKVGLGVRPTTFSLHYNIASGMNWWSKLSLNN